MNLKDAFTLYIREQSSDGSNRASSYIRAIDLLDPILSRKAAAALRRAPVPQFRPRKMLQLNKSKP
jgi:hypothetical protein